MIKEIKQRKSKGIVKDEMDDKTIDDEIYSYRLTYGNYDM